MPAPLSTIAFASSLPLSHQISSALAVSSLTTCSNHGTVRMVTPTMPSSSQRPSFPEHELSKPVKTVDIYDTTLRDGAQGEGISLSVYDKIKIAQRLDELGVAYIEGGWPGSNPKDELFFSDCPKLNNAKLVAFGSTRHKSCTKPEDDLNVISLAKANTPVITLVGKACHNQVITVLGTTLEENLNMIYDTIKYFKYDLNKEVMFDAEHFYDGYESCSEYAMKCLQFAVDAGVDVIVLCDTNGSTLPWRLNEITRNVVNTFPNVRVGAHCHNDMEMAVANSINAIEAGANLIQGTINGYGERTGNANLMSIIPILQLKMGWNVIGKENLKQLTNVSRFVDQIANQPHVTNRPFVGYSSFAHKGGLHVAAILKNSNTYQHINPEDVGNECRILVSELSGRKNIISKIKQLGWDETDWNAKSKIVLDQVKELENIGYSFEGAEASLELMLRRCESGYRAPFELTHFSVNTHNFKHKDSITMATIKLSLLGPNAGDDQEICPTKICLEVAEGNGPVDAVNEALEKALFPIYPKLRSVSLFDYKVRILDNQSKTKATTRVMVEFLNSATDKRWTTVYAHPNIIVASVNALMDGFEVAMWGTMPQCML